VIYDESGVAGPISAKAGIDYRLLLPTYRVKPYTEFVSFNGISANTDSLLSGKAQNASVTSNVTGRYPIYHNFAFYYQHAYKSRSYTTLTYGIRRDLNPAPGVRSGPHMPGLDSSQNLSSSEPLYHTRWINIAPRFGLATELTHAPKPELVFRGGIGFFFDTGCGATASVFNNPPYSNTVVTTEPAFPLSSSVIQAPVLPPPKPYGMVSGADPSLKSPVIYEFNATFEQRFGAGRVLSFGLIGSHGGGLLTTQTQPGCFCNSYSLLQLTANGGNRLPRPADSIPADGRTLSDDAGFLYFRTQHRHTIQRRGFLGLRNFAGDKQGGFELRFAPFDERHGKPGGSFSRRIARFPAARAGELVYRRRGFGPQRFAVRRAGAKRDLRRQLPQRQCFQPALVSKGLRRAGSAKPYRQAGMDRRFLCPWGTPAEFRRLLAAVEWAGQ